MNKTGVYKRICRYCDGFYIGQTGRKLSTRLKEHKELIIQNKNNIGLVSHCVKNDHPPDFENVQLLHSERKEKLLDLLEQKNKHILNVQLEFKNTMVLDKLIEKYF